MGCVCVKGVSSNEKADIKRDKGASLLSKRVVALCKKDGVTVLDADNNTGLIHEAEETAVSSPKINLDDGKKKMSAPSAVNVPALSQKGSLLQKMVGIDIVDASGMEHKPKIIEVPDGFKGEQVAAGWPPWLASVAGEAIKGWVPRKADSFEKLDKIGQGTYSNVYKARDLETGKIVALKKVRFVNMDPESVRFMAREVYVLRRLDHPNIVKLEGLVASKVSRSLYLVFEYMEHDLAGLSATPSKFPESQIKCYMKQLLCGLEHCHGRGVLHRDIKGSNLLIDNDGILRIADFGLATFFSPNKKQSLTSRVVTLWYRPPELLLGATEYGVAVDLWSSGCILAELLGGKPIMPGRTEVEQLHKIFKLCGSPSEEYWRNSKLPHATIFKPQHPYTRRVRETFKDFPASALALLDVLLAIEPQNRGTAKSALESEFFKTKPYACDPSSLPKYPPSKEFDAKLREEAARRERSSRRCSREPREVDNGTTKMERRPAKLNHKSSSQKYTEDSALGFPLDPHRGLTRNNTSCSKKATDDEHETVASQSLSARRGLHVVDLKTQRSYTQRISTNLGNLSGPLALVKPDGWERRTKPALQEQRSRRGQEDVVEASKKPEWTHLHKPVYPHKKEERVEVKDSALAYGTKKSRILYSGPLMPSGGNMDEMLKEHERQIEHAVRRARVQKGHSEESRLRVT